MFFSQARTLIGIDIIFAIIALLCGTMAFTYLVRYAVLSISLGHAAPWTYTWIIAMMVFLGITIYSYKKIYNAPIRVLVVILLFVPQIVYLLMDQTVPFPDVWFMSP